MPSLKIHISGNFCHTDYRYFIRQISPLAFGSFEVVDEEPSLNVITGEKYIPDENIELALKKHK